MERPRIVLIAPNLPYPSFAGFDLRNWQNVNGLLSFGEVGVFGLCSQDPRVTRPVPEGLAFYRCSTDPGLAYPPPENRILAQRAWLFNSFGHPSDVYYSDHAVSELKKLLTEFKPEIAVLEGLWMHRYIELLKGHGCRVVLDCHDALFPLSLQVAELTEGNDLKARIIRKILPERVKHLEQKASRAVDQIWVCSHREAGIMEALCRPPVSIHVVPNGAEVPYYESARAARDRPADRWASMSRTIVFPAMFRHEPNRVAAAFLIDDLFPLLANRFHDCRLTLAGSWPTHDMLDAARKDSRIVVTGTVPDMRPYLAAASAMVVPLFHGTGTRLKILEAFAAGLPVVSTAKGAEGLNVMSGKHLLVAESAREFVKALQRLWTTPSLAQQLTANALRLVKREYSWEAATRQIGCAIEELRQFKLSGFTESTATGR